MAYYLCDTKAEEIINEIALDKYTKRKPNQEILLGSCSCGVKSRVEKEKTTIRD